MFKENQANEKRSMKKWNKGRKGQGKLDQRGGEKWVGKVT